MRGPGVPEQLIVFAREIGELYRLERSRNAELDDRIDELKTAICATWLRITARWVRR